MDPRRPFSYVLRMPTVFVAQPFRQPFQTRYIETFKPAILAAGLEPYKVDEDPAADRLIEEIETNIKRAAAVLVDITEDNPNVWYELGFSQALNKPLVMVSCSDRGDRPYPFDIRARKVINYTTGSIAGFAKLQADITERIVALLDKEATLDELQASPLPHTAGLDPLTLMVVAVVLGETPVPGEDVSIYNVNQELERLGYSKQGIGLGIRQAKALGLLAFDVNNDGHPTVSLSAKGETFAVQHPELFNAHRTSDYPASARSFRKR